MPTKQIKISIITVNFNNREGLSKTIHSVLIQTYPHIEYIIIDGGSTDGSKELIEQHTNCLYYWISEKDKGIYDAMNKGIIQASGEYCLFLNSGDYFLHSNILSKIFSKEEYESDILIGRQKFINSKGIISKAPRLRKEEINMSFFLSSTIPHQATFIKRDLFHKCGLYNKEYHIVADWVFWIEAIIKEKCCIKILPEYISYMENGGVSNDMDNCHAEMESYLAKCLKDGTLKWNDIFECALKYRSQELAMRHKITAIISKIITWIGKYY